MKEFSTLVKEKKKAEMQRVKLLWSSLSQPKEAIPSSQLYPPKESIFEAVWTTTIQPEYDEVYTFDIGAAEPVRVWVDGELVIDGTNVPLGGNASQTGSLSLNAGHSYNIKVEYVDNDEAVAGGWVNLDWDSPSQGSENLLFLETDWFDGMDFAEDGGSGGGPNHCPLLPVGNDYWKTNTFRRKPLEAELFSGDSGDFSLSWDAPSGDEEFLDVEVYIDGPLGDIFEKTGDLDFIARDQYFTLTPEDDGKTLSGSLKNIELSQFEKDVLLGSVITVTETRTFEDGSTQILRKPYRLYRWLDVVGAKENLGTMAGLNTKEENGLGAFGKTKEFDYVLPEWEELVLKGAKQDIDYTSTQQGLMGNGTAKWEYKETLPINFTPQEGGNFTGGTGNFVEDTVMLTVAGIELPLEIKGQVSIADRVKEIEVQRIEAFTNTELVDTEIAEISLQGMQAKLQAADNSTNNLNQPMRSALVYLTMRKQNGVEGVEVIMVPGDPNEAPVHRFVEVPFDKFRENSSRFSSHVTNARRPSQYRVNGEFLYDNTIGQIAGDIQQLGINHLQIIPDPIFTRITTQMQDGENKTVAIPVLQHIPYGALVNPDGEHLIEQFSLAISPSFHETIAKHHNMTNAERLVL